MKRTLLAAITIIAISASWTAYSAGIPINPNGLIHTPPQGVGFVKDSYIVTFNEPTGTETPLIQRPDRAANLNRAPVSFGEHSTGQSKAELAHTLGIKGQVARIFETINSAHILMNSQEAYKLSLDKRVLRVQQEAITTVAATQTNPQWGLDRLDSATASLNSSYTYTNNGTGQTIYVLDSGLNIGTSSVTAEFGGRATMFFDFNTGGTGNDCVGHGSEVASAAAGNTYGVAKGASLNIVKITSGCTGSAPVANSVAAFNWFAANVPPGTIVNWSQSFSAPYTINQNGDPVFTCGSYFDSTLEGAIRSAFNAGVIVVVAAGNDACNTANYSPTNIPEAFVVGATQNSLLNTSDAIAEFHGTGGTGNGGTRTGWNISTFAPGRDVRMLWNVDGFYATDSGTSFSAPYIAGIFAVACQAVAPACTTAGSSALYTALRGSGTLNTVVNPNGTALTGSTSRFIWQQW